MIRDGQSFLEEARFEEALACFHRAAGPRALFGRAVALHLLGRFEEAEAAYALLLESNPRHEEALSNLIALNVEKFDLARVERYALRLLEAVPDCPIALQGLIVVALERRDDNLAANCLARLSQPAPGSRDAVEYRLSAQTVVRLKDQHGPVAHSY